MFPNGRNDLITSCAVSEVPGGNATGVPVGDAVSFPSGAGGVDGSARLGLSLASNLTDGKKESQSDNNNQGNFRLLGFLGSSYMSLKAPSRGVLPRFAGGVRKACTGFSAASRLAMMKRLAFLKQSAVCRALFVTLTYPAVFPDTDRAKRDLDVFLKRLLRAFPEAAGLWRIEAQTRGAPHYHLVLLGVERIPHEWIAENWYEVADTGDERHLSAGTEIRRVKSYHQAVYYVSKYLTKESAGGSSDDGLGLAGRRWGSFGNWQRFLGEFVSIVLTHKESARLCRVLDAKRLSNARVRVKFRGSAIRRARKRQALGFSRFWFGSPDFIFQRIIAIIGRRDDAAI